MGLEIIGKLQAKWYDKMIYVCPQCGRLVEYYWGEYYEPEGVVCYDCHSLFFDSHPGFVQFENPYWKPKERTPLQSRMEAWAVAKLLERAEPHLNFEKFALAA